jgi:hypothetical protein
MFLNLSGKKSIQNRPTGNTKNVFGAIQRAFDGTEKMFLDLKASLAFAGLDH